MKLQSTSHCLERNPSEQLHYPPPPSLATSASILNRLIYRETANTLRWLERWLSCYNRPLFPKETWVQSPRTHMGAYHHL